MGKDTCAREYYSDRARYADVINGLVFNGQQLVAEEDLQELDSRVGNKVRDLLRKIEFDGDIVTIGIENQDYIDYAMPQRTLFYEALEYDRQKALIRKNIEKEMKKDPDGTTLSSGEYLGRFRQASRLVPHVTLVLYYGQESWDGAANLTDIINFGNVPKAFRKLVQNYQTHVIEVRKLEDTSVFHTDVKQVFDFIRCSDDKEKLDHLIRSDPAFQRLDRKAYEFMSHYGKAHSLLQCKVYKGEGDVIDMCKALDELYEDWKEIGKEIGKEEGVEQEKRNTILRMLQDSMPLEQILRFCDCTAEYVERVRLRGETNQKQNYWAAV